MPKRFGFLDNMGMQIDLDREETTMCEGWSCGQCGEMFDEPAEDGLCRDICPECGSLEIYELDDAEEPDGT